MKRLLMAAGAPGPGRRCRSNVRGGFRLARQRARRDAHRRRGFVAPASSPLTPASPAVGRLTAQRYPDCTFGDADRRGAPCH